MASGICCAVQETAPWRQHYAARVRQVSERPNQYCGFVPVAEELDYLEVVASESERFRAVVTSLQAGAGLSSPVPTCPEWDAADLIWHLAEVQYFWTSIVANRPADHTMVAELVRPGDDELIEVLGLWSGRLRSELEAADVGEGCWSWHPAGHNVGWARRRQAHEALIHRVDAELTAAAAGAPFAAAPIDAALAADGIDEMLAVMLGGAYPSPTRHFDADGTS
ncbi:MAG: hypothetical protein EX269_12530, partial [Acidimicrobiales bacterium]